MQTPPTPWRLLAVNEEYCSAWLGDANGATVAHVFGDDPEHARAIVEAMAAAMNGRERMREALENMRTAAVYAWGAQAKKANEALRREAEAKFFKAADEARAALKEGSRP